jgi:hypothetical protein
LKQNHFPRAGFKSKSFRTGNIQAANVSAERMWKHFLIPRPPARISMAYGNNRTRWKRCVSVLMLEKVGN